MSVYKRGGVYWYDFWFRGVRDRDSTRLVNKAAAAQVEAIRKAELATGRVGIISRDHCPIFKDFVTAEFLPWSDRQHQAHPRTYLRHKVSAKPLMEFFGKLPVDAILPAHVEKFKLARSHNVSPGGVNRDLAALRLMLNFATRQGHIVRNPVVGIRFLSEGPGVMRIVSHEEQSRYLGAANPLLRDVATTMLETGMRPEEVFTTRKENVHLVQRYLFCADRQDEVRSAQRTAHRRHRCNPEASAGARRRAVSVSPPARS